jgi:hypothetical protein
MHAVALIAELSVWTALVLYQMRKYGIDDLELLASKLEDRDAWIE